MSDKGQYILKEARENIEKSSYETIYLLYDLLR